MKVGRSSNSERTEVEEGLRQLFSTAMGDDTDELNNGSPLSEWGAQNINGELGILAGELFTSTAIYMLQLQPRQKACFKLAKKKAAPKDTRQPDSLSHDRSKNHFLSPSAEFLQKLGVSNADGKPVNGMASKLRQCQKFVEIVGNLVDGASGSSSPPSGIRVIDMGCGRGYLTFSLHSYLCNKFGANDAINVVTQGIDRRPKLIEEINGIASDLGGEFSTLNFVESTIGETHGFFGDDALRENAKTDDSLDILIALHACDTATDDALWFAIGRGAGVIVTAPCCQHELRPQIDRCAADNPDHPLSEVLRHAIYRERSTEIVTDAMRAILLEIAGYSTQVFEFIGGEHTAKNVMLAATKVKPRRSGKEQEEWLQKRRVKLRELAQLYGIKRQRLAMLMGENISPEDGDGNAHKEKNVARNLSEGTSDWSVDAGPTEKLNTAFLSSIVEQFKDNPYIDMSPMLEEYQAFALRVENGEIGEDGDEDSAFEFTPCPLSFPGIPQEVVDELTKGSSALWKKVATEMAGSEHPAGAGDTLMGDASVSRKTDTGAVTSSHVSTSVSTKSIERAASKSAKRRREDVNLAGDAKVEAVIDAVKKQRL
ncbi:hypothetical protein ACHAXT_003589 [Thalassiosira profunda]